MDHNQVTSPRIPVIYWYPGAPSSAEGVGFELYPPSFGRAAVRKEPRKVNDL
jgi:hypothetical protein